MMTSIFKKLFGFRKDDSGAALLYITIAIPTLLAITSVAIDVGYVFYVKTRLQTAADMGALAGASKLYTDNAKAVTDLATTYVNYNLPTAWTGASPPTASSTPEVKCLDTIKTMGLTCSSLSGGNALKVTVTATAPLFFAKALGFSSIALSANSLVSGGGSSPPPLNVAIILDATGSMSASLGTSCGILTNPTKIQCASLAAKTLLTKLWASVDQVALYTYPSYDPNSKNIFSCAKGASGSINSVSYMTGASPNYRMFDFTNSYMDTGSPPKGGLITTSDMVLALGKSASTKTANDSTTCNGFSVSGLGGQGTSIADAIAQAQKDLLAANVALVNAGQPKRQNVMIILSDGDANANTDGNATLDSFVTGTDNSNWTIDVPRQMKQCQSAVSAADTAATEGTWVYSIAFGADNTPKSTCWSDRPVTTVIDTKGPFTPVPTTRNCTNGNKCKAIAAVSSVTSTIAPVSSSKQIATSTTRTTVTTCTKPDGSTSGTCTTTVTPTQIQTDTYDLNTYSTTACATMKAIASDDSKFYSTDGNTKCASAANPNFTDLVSIFNNVAASIMKKRRIPSSTT